MRTIILIFFFFEICAENFANFGGYTYAFDRFISVDFLAGFNEPDGKQAYKFGSSDNGSVINFDSVFFDKAFEEQFFAESVTQAINYSQSDSGEAIENVNNNKEVKFGNLSINWSIFWTLCMFGNGWFYQFQLGFFWGFWQ